MISDERLQAIADGEEFRVGTITDMAQELLALRKAAIPEEFLNAKQNASGMFEISEDCMCQLLNMLCSKPTLP